MLDAISLTEEELGVLFGPASHGAGDNPSLLQPRAAAGSRKSTPSRARVSNASDKHAVATKKTRTTIANANAAVPARCGYRTGKCQNLQAIKRNGKLHKLCEFHRERANLNQKKLDRKKRMQRSKMSCGSVSSASSVTSEDDSQSLDLENCSPRTVEAVMTSNGFIKAEAKKKCDDLDTELFLPTSLHEAPLALGCEELAIFCSLMTFDVNHRALPNRDAPPVCTPSCHYHTSLV